MAAATKLDLYQMAARHLADARFDLITDDVETRYAFDDAWPRAVEFVLRLAAWRFALKTVTLTGTPGTLPGMLTAYGKPADWLRTHAIYQINAARHECPLDVREQGVKIHGNAISSLPVQIRYVSAEFIDPALAGNPWPEHFAQVLAAYLAFLTAERVTGERSAPARMSQLFSELLPEAVAIDAIPEDLWLPHQLSGAFARGSRAVVERGFWRKHIKTVQIEAQLAEPAMVGLPYRFALPDDWMRTQSLYVPWDGEESPFNIRETAEDWSTDTQAFVASYLSTDALDATTWPEPLAKAVMAYLGWQGEPASDDGDKAAQVRAPAYVKLLDDALQLYSVRESPWLRFQLDGSYQDAVKLVLERGRWRFAIRTVELQPNTDPTGIGDGTVSPGYTYRFMRPNDHLRTMWVYHSPYSGLAEERVDIDYRDELDGIHANYTPIRLRYLTRLGLDATQWTRNFRDAVLAWLQYTEVRDDPKMASVARAKLEFFKDQVKTAEALDDAREMPRVNNIGRFVRGRYGWRGENGHGMTGGVSPSVSGGVLGDEGDGLLGDEGP